MARLLQALSLLSIAGLGGLQLAGCSLVKPGTVDEELDGLVRAAGLDPWRGCGVQVEPNSVGIRCGRARRAVSIQVTDSREQSLITTAQKVIDGELGAHASVEYPTIKLEDGKTVQAVVATKTFTKIYAKGDLDLMVMVVGVDGADGKSRRLLWCLASDAVACMDDIEEIYARPPAASR